MRGERGGGKYSLVDTRGVAIKKAGPLWFNRFLSKATDSDCFNLVAKERGVSVTGLSFCMVFKINSFNTSIFVLNINFGAFR